MLRPLRDRIVIKPHERIKSSILAVIMSEKPNTGTVVAVGPGTEDKRGRLMPLAVKVGDQIRYGTANEYLSYPEYLENGEKYLVMQEADVCWISE